VPIGVPGELFIGGAGLARGYLGRPNLTAERFVPDPFSTTPGQRLYRTGDRVRWRSDGQLDFLGRVDRQVKLRGFRIELGEIEAALVGVPGVQDTVVLLREDSPGQPRLVAYVVPREATRFAESDVRQALGRQLPEYMVPTTFVLLSELPLTPNGKVDRQALPAPRLAADVVVGSEPLANDTERVIAGIWADVLGQPNVGRHTNFFDLGGHSLQLLQVHGHLRERFGVDLTVVDLFRHPTVSALAQRLTHLDAAGDVADAGRTRAATRRALLGNRRTARPATAS
jgi:aryl carrier-like protein